MTNSIHAGGALWFRFRDAFMTAVSAMETEQLTAAWASQTARTIFYRDSILKSVPELFKVDFVMATQSSSGLQVPVIFIESENIAISASHEVCKLSALAVPLRVLITVVEWSDLWTTGGRRKILLPQWQSIVRAHAEIWPHPGWLGIVIGEWGPDSHLRFYTLALGPDGEIRDPEAMKVDRLVGRGGP
jgi:hypothetical protein